MVGDKDNLEKYRAAVEAGQVQQLRDQGLTHRAIGEQYGVSVSTVERTFRPEMRLYKRERGYEFKLTPLTRRVLCEPW